ncbi:MAG: cytochrome c [Roseovarius sp.]
MKYALIPLAFLLLGCTTEAQPDVSRATGQALFADNCAICHGMDATGGGPLAPELATRPADLKRIAQRRDGVWPRLEIMAIVDGYAKRSNPRDDMPVIVGLTEGPLVDYDTGNGVLTPTPARLVAVVAYLESLQNPRPTSYVP